MGTRNGTDTVFLLGSSSTTPKRNGGKKKVVVVFLKQVKISLLSKNASCDNVSKGKLLLPFFKQQNSSFSVENMFNSCLELTILNLREMRHCKVREFENPT